ncbi:hypothetical protein LX36DRAFT_165214 [Colletotrichum falcatum]|nr:hypothetical protein LX36DRAFT_165214 [Colletotrichum falcatum]
MLSLISFSFFFLLFYFSSSALRFCSSAVHHLAPLRAFHSGVRPAMRESLEGGGLTDGQAWRFVAVGEVLPRHCRTIRRHADISAAQGWGTWLVFSGQSPTSTIPTPPYQTRYTQRVVTAPAWQQRRQNAPGLAQLATSQFCFTCCFCLVSLQIEVAFGSRRPLIKCQALRQTKPQ